MTVQATPAQERLVARLREVLFFEGPVREGESREDAKRSILAKVQRA